MLPSRTGKRSLLCCRQTAVPFVGSVSHSNRIPVDYIVWYTACRSHCRGPFAINAQRNYVITGVWQCDEENNNRSGGKGTSMFLMSQGAAPNKCIINGPSLTYALVQQPTFFYLTARDTYGNLARNGGEMFEVKVFAPEASHKQIEQMNAEPDEPPKIQDRKDGAHCKC